MDFRDGLEAVLVGLGIGVVFFVIGGVAAPFFAGVNGPVLGAIGFLLGAAGMLIKK